MGMTTKTFFCTEKMVEICKSIVMFVKSSLIYKYVNYGFCREL